METAHQNFQGPKAGDFLSYDTPVIIPVACPGLGLNADLLKMMDFVFFLNLDEDTYSVGSVQSTLAGRRYERNNRSKKGKHKKDPAKFKAIHKTVDWADW